MPGLISFLLFLLVVLIIAAAILGVARAILALPVLEPVRPYANVVYALVVLIVVLLCVGLLYGGVEPTRAWLH